MTRPNSVSREDFVQRLKFFQTLAEAPPPRAGGLCFSPVEHPLLGPPRDSAFDFLDGSDDEEAPTLDPPFVAVSAEDAANAIPSFWKDLVQKHNESVTKVNFPRFLPPVTPQQFVGLFS
jgi:hypothetical protein